MLLCLVWDFSSISTSIPDFGMSHYTCFQYSFPPLVLTKIVFDILLVIIRLVFKQLGDLSSFFVLLYYQTRDSRSW